jgi:hypothetical protein
MVVVGSYVGWHCFQFWVGGGAQEIKVMEVGVKG